MYCRDLKPQEPWQTHGFRLTNGRDFLGVYLHWLRLAANEANLLCGHARMDGDDFLQCTGFYEYPTDDVISRVLRGSASNGCGGYIYINQF
ncbi:hypothetical protein TNCV_3140071 [Trichonephila clavipes]|nr:hypothetical protein TNCV_3140071 [Trichonephila clavipes]